MGGKGSRKRKGGGLSTPGFGGGGPGGRFGGLLSPSPTPSVGGWETEDGGSEVVVSRETVAKVPRVGVAESVADVAALVSGVEGLDMDDYVGKEDIGLLKSAIWNLEVLPEVRSGLLDLLDEVDLGVRLASESLVELMTVKRELVGVREELSEARAALEKVEYHLSAKVPMLGSDEKGVWVGVNKLRWEIITARGEKECSLKREQATYLENRKLLGKVKRLETGRVLRGVDKGTQMSAPPAPPVCVGSGTQTVGGELRVAGVQTVGAEVSVVGVQTDISGVQVVRETTYASVATQASACVVPADGDTVMGGVGAPGPPPGSARVWDEGGSWGSAGGGGAGAPGMGPRPADGVVRAQALLIHGVDCRSGVGSLLAAARRLNVGNCTVRGVRWLLGVDRRRGKRLSSVVVYLDRPVEVRDHSVWFGGALHPVERYVFGR